MAKKDLKLEPHNITDDIWWYEDNRGIDLHVECICPSGQHDHINVLILWSDIRKVLKRRDA